MSHLSCYLHNTHSFLQFATDRGRQQTSGWRIKKRSLRDNVKRTWSQNSWTIRIPLSTADRQSSVTSEVAIYHQRVIAEKCRQMSASFHSKPAMKELPDSLPHTQGVFRCIPLCLVSLSDIFCRMFLPEWIFFKQVRSRRHTSRKVGRSCDSSLFLPSVTSCFRWCLPSEFISVSLLGAG